MIEVSLDDPPILKALELVNLNYQTSKTGQNLLLKLAKLNVTESDSFKLLLMSIYFFQCVR